MLTKLTIRNFKRFGEIERSSWGIPSCSLAPTIRGKPRPCRLWPCGTPASSDGTKSLQAKTIRKGTPG